MPLIDYASITFSPYLAHGTVAQKINSLNRLKDFFVAHAGIKTSFPAEEALAPFLEGLFDLSDNAQLEVIQAGLNGIDRVRIEALGFQTASRQETGFNF